MRVRDLAFARSSDKGNHVDIGVFARDDAAYRVLADYLTADRVAAYFAPFGIGRVERYEVASLLALKFVIRDALEGGAASCIRADNQGKTWSGALLRMELPEGFRTGA